MAYGSGVNLDGPYSPDLARTTSGGSPEAVSWAFHQPLPGTLKVTLVALAWTCRGGAACCSPSVAQLAAWTGLDARTVRRALRELEAAGLILTRLRMPLASRYQLQLGQEAGQ